MGPQSGAPSKVSARAEPRRVATGDATRPAARQLRGLYSKYAEITGTRTKVYVLVAAWLAVWTFIHLYIVTSVFTNAVLFLSYYVVNYRYGFVRRGLAGELIAIFPDRNYYTAAYLVLWASITIWLIALMWLSISTGVRSERRIMLALVVPVLPFAFSYAVYNPHPELFGMAVLLAFSVSLTRTTAHRSRMILAGVYGIATAVLALVHEAIPLEFALGAILAIIVLAKDATHAAQRIYATLAVGPGIAAVLLVAALGRRDVSAQLCSQMPHGMVEDPWAVSGTPKKAVDYFLSGAQSQSDYHDWVCNNLAPAIDLDMFSAFHQVGRFGFFWLSESFMIGLLYFFCTIGLMRYFAGVPIRVFVNQIRGNLTLPALASLSLVPLFLVAVDWTRWWVLISFDVSIVYILHAIARQEIEQPPSRRQFVVFVCVVLVLAVIPTGVVNNAGSYPQP